MIALAQVHATLAVADQQRTANLIAYAAHRLEHRNAVGDGHYPAALATLLGRLDFEIRERLVGDDEQAEE